MTPLHVVGTIDRMYGCDICCGKLVFKGISLVPEAYYWYELSIFCSLQATCLDQLILYATYVYIVFANVKLLIQFLKVLSRFHWKRI